MSDKPAYEFVFTRHWQLRWRYRWSHVWFALRCLWNALRGYELSIKYHREKRMVWSAGDPP